MCVCVCDIYIYKININLLLEYLKILKFKLLDNKLVIVA